MERSTAVRSRSRWVERLATLAALVAVFGVGNLIAWGNRWYVTERFAQSAASDDAAEWEWLYELLHSAHEALVRGVALLLVAGLLAALAVWLRRRSLRRAAAGPARA